MGRAKIQRWECVCKVQGWQEGQCSWTVAGRGAQGPERAMFSGLQFGLSPHNGRKPRRVLSLGCGVGGRVWFAFWETTVDAGWRTNCTEV